MKQTFLFLAFLISVRTLCNAQAEYPYPVSYITVHIEDSSYRMAYMDVRPTNEARGNVLLLHGKNFNGYYWKQVIKTLSQNGFRVIVPDQLGWGKSERPLIQYSFHTLAFNTRTLLDSLKISKVFIVGHSMGGMLATRFSLLFPQYVDKLILENPIGLEDYRIFVPYVQVDSLVSKEKKATYQSYLKYQQSYYPVWRTEYEQYVVAQAEDLFRSNFDTIAIVNARTFQMIYDQPVVYEFEQIKVKTLLIIGQADRTIVGKDRLDEATKRIYGDYPNLGKLVQKRIAGSQLIELPGVGHIPHIQEPVKFIDILSEFILKK